MVFFSNYEPAKDVDGESQAMIPQGAKRKGEERCGG